MTQASTTTKTTTVVTEVPDARRWQGRDWGKAAITGALLLALLRPNASPEPTAQATTVPAVVPAATVVAAPTAVPAVQPTAVPAVQPTAQATVVAAPVAAIPLVLSTREVIFAGPYTLQGTGTPGSIVELLVNGASIGTATVGADGRWSLDTTLEAGDNEILARAVDSAGAMLAQGDAVRLGVQAAPVAVAAPSFNAPPGELVGGPALLSGTGEPGSTVRVKVGGVDAGEAKVGADGTWELDAILPAGVQAIVVEAIGNDGAVLATSAPTSATVVGGLGVVVAQPVEGAELPAGPTTVSGTGVAGTVLEILNGDQVLGEVTVGADGTWSAEVPLVDGTSSISVRAKGTDQILNRPVRVQVGTALGGAACTEIAVSCEAWVTRTGGLTLRMRSAGAILADNIVARLPIGTQMTVLEGPSPADGFTWWRVRTVGGNEGWVAGENLVIQPD